MENIQISDERLDIAVMAAERAGDAASSVKNTTTQERKGNDTIVTEADKESEEIVREVLNENSTYPILGEEQGGDVKNEDTYWVVDPIDGTKNFSYQQPIYGNGVALVEDNEPVIGVFYMPDIYTTLG
jgi:fructose-1,6-bisphosphatase/inositol monophosphatase family enzyme